MCYVSVVKENETPGHTSDGWMNESKGPDAGVFFPNRQWAQGLPSKQLK